MTELPEGNPDVIAAAAPERSMSATPHEEPVLVFDAASVEEAEVVRATLEAAGIPARLENPDSMAGAGTIGETVGNTWSNGVFVMPSHLEAARAILNTPSPTDEELGDESEADPTTLEEAEARIKNA